MATTWFPGAFLISEKKAESSKRAAAEKKIPLPLKKRICTHHDRGLSDILYLKAV